MAATKRPDAGAAKALDELRVDSICRAARDVVARQVERLQTADVVSFEDAQALAALMRALALTIAAQQAHGSARRVLDDAEAAAAEERDEAVLRLMGKR